MQVQLAQQTQDFDQLTILIRMISLFSFRCFDRFSCQIAFEAGEFGERDDVLTNINPNTEPLNMGWDDSPEWKFIALHFRCRATHAIAHVNEVKEKENQFEGALFHPSYQFSI